MCLCEISPLSPSREDHYLPHICHHINTHSRTHQGKTVVGLEVQWSWLDTHITLERFLSRVGPHVLVQSSFLAEGLVALAALIRLLLQATNTHTPNFKEGIRSVSVQAAQYIKQHVLSLITYGHNLERNSCPLWQTQE